jgi:transcriptional regulator with XRE-family HTH domain
LLTAGQLKAARALVGMEQKALSQASGVSLPTIQRMEASNGTVRGVIESLTKVMAALEAAGIEVYQRRRAQFGGRPRSAPAQTPGVNQHFPDGLPIHPPWDRRGGGPPARSAEALFGAAKQPNFLRPSPPHSSSRRLEPHYGHSSPGGRLGRKLRRRNRHPVGPGRKTSMRTRMRRNRSPARRPQPPVK